MLTAIYNWLGWMLMADDNENEELAIRERARTAFRAFRTTRGWSQREMAKFLQVSEDNYESYESRDDRGMPLSLIGRFCKFTDTDANWIMCGTKSAAKAG